MARKPTPKANRPRPVFKDIWTVEHVKRQMLALPVVRRSRVVPYGYEEDPDNPWRMIPNYDLFKALLKARDYLEMGHSGPNVNIWLEAVTGKSITVSNMMLIMRDRYPLNEIMELTEDERERLTSPGIDYWGQAPKSSSKYLLGRDFLERAGDQSPKGKEVHSEGEGT